MYTKRSIRVQLFTELLKKNMPNSLLLAVMDVASLTDSYFEARLLLY